MADIIELILADHQRIRRLLGALDDAARYGEGPGVGKALAQVWRRLAGLLELHAEAEEEICYLALFGPGQDATAQMQDAIDDHDDIREAVREARLHAAGSAIWWRAVNAALRASRDHIAREESGALAAFGRRAAPALRDELGRQWTAFIAARTRDAPPEHAHLRPQSRTSPATREGSARYNVSQKPAAGPGSEHNDQAGDGPGHAYAGQSGAERRRGHDRGQDQGAQRTPAVAAAVGEEEPAGPGPGREGLRSAGAGDPET